METVFPEYPIVGGLTIILDIPTYYEFVSTECLFSLFFHSIFYNYFYVLRYRQSLFSRTHRIEIKKKTLTRIKVYIKCYDNYNILTFGMVACM